MITLEELGRRACEAKYLVGGLETEVKNSALAAVAGALTDNADTIIKENEKDLQRGRDNGMHQGLLDRLMLDAGRIKAMAEGLLQIAELPDPVGLTLDSFVRPNGLEIRKVSVPMGVIGIIYESRPNVTADAFGLCFKAGSAVILRGGSDAILSNIAITNTIREALKTCGITEDAIALIEDTSRETAKEFMRLDRYVDLLIPRGSAGLIRQAVMDSTIPIIETGTGNCHVFVDESADLDMAAAIVVNAKTQRIGVCNSCESLVLHKSIADKFLPLIKKELDKVHAVEIRGDETVCSLLSSAALATEEDYGREYLDYIMSAVTVSDADEAIAHINRYSTGHSDTIVTSSQENADKFLKQIDSACVYVNASTRFTDGFEFGFGAEIGISTQKLHARGPMGLKELTSYKYTIKGNGQVR